MRLARNLTAGTAAKHEILDSRTAAIVHALAYMPPKYRAFVVLTFLAVATATASAQFPPLSAYRLLDTGAVSVAAMCACIREPFRVPEFVPTGYASGPAAPLETDTLSSRARQIAAMGGADDRAILHAKAAAGLAGSPGDSFGMAMDLALRGLLSDTIDAEIDKQASLWFQMAAYQGHHDAFVRLAYRFRHGRGVQQDDGAAAYWTHQGAIRRETLAMVGMGLTFASGRGVPQDWTAALHWWRRAAPTNALATRFIGDAYVCGLGVERNHERAVEAYLSAAKRGEISASVRLGDLYAGGCVADPDGAAIRAYTDAADHGYPDAQVALSELLREGRGTYPDSYRAYQLARLAERRLPDGELKTLAAERARAAADLLPEFLIRDADRMISGLLSAVGR